MSVSSSMAPAPGRPFTLWLDPLRWPVVPFRLPGAAFTLWQDPARWPAVKFKLPGAGFTLWQDPARWPMPLKQLPGAGFTLWLDPETWPKPRFMEHPTLTDVKSAVLPPPPEVAKPIASLNEVPSPAPMPISLPHNKAFTLWTRPSQVSLIPMKNGLTAAQLAAESNPAPVPQVALPMVPAPIVQPAHQPAKMVHSPAESWLPLAAAVVAILGINSMIKVTDTKVSKAMQSDLATTSASVDKKLKDFGTAHALDLKARDAKLAEVEALNTALKQQKDLLVTDLAKAQESLKQVASTQKEQDTRLVQMTKELEQAKAVASGADSKAQALVQSAQEEASKIKRESGAALVALQASQAKLEAEKAAALKAAADAAAALAALQAKWDALPKATP